MSSLEPARGPDASRVPVSPQLALRVAVLGTIALVMFGIIFFRLWYLQILSGAGYRAQAQAQKTRTLPIAAPRGQILSSGGRVLVSSKTTNAVQIVPSELPESISSQLEAYEARVKHAGKLEVPIDARIASVKARLNTLAGEEGTGAHHRRPTPAQLRLRARAHLYEGRLRRLEGRLAAIRRIPVPPLPASNRRLHGLFRRLGGVLRMRPRVIDERVIRDVYSTRYAPVSIDAAAGRGPLTVLAERRNEFPGVVQRQVAIRAYPFGEMAAQLFGTVGQISAQEMKSPAFKGVHEGTVVGQEGLEYTYNKYLEGTPGRETVQVNASGEPVGSQLKEIQPKAGYSLRTSLDVGLQQAGEKALREQISIANAAGKPADGGAFVAMDPLNGEIYAMGSYPSYDPEVFTKPMSQSEYERLFPAETPPSGGQPLLNRAVQAAYPTGSTFKPITATGALEAGAFSPYEDFGGGRCLEPELNRYCNAESVNYAATELVHALEESSDTYFYTVGRRANAYGPVIQKMARRLGIGKATGVDLPEGSPGVVPDAKWLRALEQAERACTRREGKPCGYVSEVNKPWTYGENMNLAVGQGALQTSPLQMAVAYSALINAYRSGGEAVVVTPHLGLQIDEADGALVQALKFPPRRRFHLDPTYQDLIFEGIHDATIGPSGTSTNVWVGWNQAKYPTYGKTGTAERPLQETQAWYMCYIGSEKRPIVMAITVEQGGYGDTAAAPVARALATQWYLHPSKGAGAPRHG